MRFGSNPSRDTHARHPSIGRRWSRVSFCDCVADYGSVQSQQRAGKLAPACPGDRERPDQQNGRRRRGACAPQKLRPTGKWRGSAVLLSTLLDTARTRWSTCTMTRA